jgi:hypothetical protein
MLPVDASHHDMVYTGIASLAFCSRHNVVPQNNISTQVSVWQDNMNRPYYVAIMSTLLPHIYFNTIKSFQKEME